MKMCSAKDYEVKVKIEQKSLYPKICKNLFNMFAMMLTRVCRKNVNVF